MEVGCCVGCCCSGVGGVVGGGGGGGVDGVGGGGEEAGCRAGVSGEVEERGGVWVVGDRGWEEAETVAEFGCCWFERLGFFWLTRAVGLFLGGRWGM